MPRWVLALAALAAGAVAVLYARRKAHPALEAPAPAEAAESDADRLLAELDPQPKDRVLQLGLGADELTFALAERLSDGKLEVFDADQAAADGLADRARARGLNNVSGWHGDPHSLLFEDDRFDRALVLDAQDEPAKRELERVLKPDGRYVATVAESDGD